MMGLLIIMMAGYVWAEEGIPEGYLLIEGDILLPVDAAYDATYGATYWPNGVVPYEFHANVNATNQQRAIDAMAEWSAIANLTFVLRTTQTNRIRFMDHPDRNYSEIGMVGGSQDIAIVSWTTQIIIAHEIAHALGFWHEQSRPDREEYVIINWDRIEEDFKHNFNIRPLAFVYGPYDFDSAMHYGQCSFSTCVSCSADLDACRTITAKPDYAGSQSMMGQRTHLSYLDQVSMQMVYSGTDWIFIDGTYAGWPINLEFGTFEMPYDTFGEGISAVTNGGTLIVQPDTYELTDNYLFSRNMLIRAPLGDTLFK